MRKKELKALKFAQARLDAILAGTRDEPTTCGTFKTSAGIGCEPFTENQKRQIRIYLDSWVSEPLNAVVSALEGARDWETENYLDSF